jgi:hypothetical protein
MSRLTKIDVAEAHLVTAVRATFRGEHPASIYLLAASAREILTTISERYFTEHRRIRGKNLAD